MPRLVVSAHAQRDAARLRDFLREKNPKAARRAAEAIKQHVLALRLHPEMGRPRPEDANLRELPIPFGDGGYVALYRFVRDEDTVIVLAFRHQKELGY